MRYSSDNVTCAVSLRKVFSRSGRSQRAITMAVTVACLLVAVAMVAVVPALADDNSFSTRYSEFRIVDRGANLRELVSDVREENGSPSWPVPGTANRRLVFETTIPWRSGMDVVVLRRPMPSYACPARNPRRYQFVAVPEMGYPRATEVSAYCSVGILAMRVSHDMIELDIAVRQPNLDKVTIRFDGSAFQEIEVPRDGSGVLNAGTGSDVTRWASHHPSQILQAPSEWYRFSTIMSPDDLEELWYNIQVAARRETQVVDGVLVAWGCRAHWCPEAKAGIAIEVATGRPHAVTCTHEHGIRAFGSAPSLLPVPLRALLARYCIVWNDTE